MNEVRMKLSPPWVTYINKVQALFGGDPELAISVDIAVPSIKIATKNGDKAAALIRLLPDHICMGSVTLQIEIDAPISNLAFTSNKHLFETAFNGNAAFAYCVCPDDEGYYFINYTYVVFKNCVVQFFNDNLDDPHGVLSTLYQNIAAEVFSEAHLVPSGIVSYCTDIEVGHLGKPLGEWP